MDKYNVILPGVYGNANYMWLSKKLNDGPCMKATFVIVSLIVCVIPAAQTWVYTVDKLIPTVTI